MTGLIDYIAWRGDLDFKNAPLNHVDNLIISKLSYFPFKELLTDPKENTLGNIATKYLQDLENESLGLLLSSDYFTLLEALKNSKRYRALHISECVEVFCEDVEVQFAAMTIAIDRKTAYIAFRGTDDSILGWKEDFNMSFLDTVPAQKEALKYINRVGKNYKNIYVGGHSKGGNLAVFASVHADLKIQKKIIHVYNNDGPGFKENMLTSERYKRIQSRVITLVPQSSIVGMLLEHEENYLVVKSNQIGMMQHDGFSWEVIGPDFVYLSDVDADSRMLDMTIKNVLNTMDDEQREAFTNILFDILSVNENRTLIDLKKDGLKTIHAMFKNYTNLDKKTKKAITKMTTLFFEEGYRSFKEVSNSEQWKSKRLKLQSKNQK